VDEPTTEVLDKVQPTVTNEMNDDLLAPFTKKSLTATQFVQWNLDDTPGRLTSGAKLMSQKTRLDPIFFPC
jgi:hypothetical protein